MARITLENVRKGYRDAARELVVLSGLTCEFPQDAAVAVMGRSGIGKSTLLHILGGLDRPSAGDVCYDGKSISSLRDEQLSRFRGENVGFVFQFHHLLPEFSALENVAMPLWIRGGADSEAVRRAQEMLEAVGLADRMTHRPSQLSGGEQQRVALARAMVGKPRVLLADEPTGNLDVHTAADIERLLLNMRREQKTTLIIVTHSEELARKMDVVLEMQPGGELRARSKG